MFFRSDNAASVHPAVFDALVRANGVDVAYDGDALSLSLDAAFSDLFETDVVALWIATGTAANAIGLATLVPPYLGILCHRDAHIQVDEAGAPEFYTGGSKLILVEGDGAKLTPQTLNDRIASAGDSVHQVRPAAISISNATEYGLTYSASDVGAIGDLAKARGLKLHMDGARFANAAVCGNASPADLTWRAGVDVLSFGFIKNGGLSAEALILFDTRLADQARIRRKRAGHLASKGRFMAAQLLALLEDDRWLSNARAANDGATRIAKAAAERLLYRVEANEVFVRMTAEESASLRAKSFDFYDWATGEARFVVSWNQPDDEVEALAAALAAL